MICRSRCASEADVSRYVRNMIASDPRTNSVAYQTPSRSPYTGRRVSRSGADDIPHTPHGVQQLLLEAAIDLLAQPAHEHVDDVRLRIEVVVPDVRQDHRLRDDLVDVPQEVFEQRELPRPEVDGDVAARHATR